MRAREVRASVSIRRAIVAHARRDRPTECCGLLLGHGRVITHAVPMRNVAASPVRYRIDDAEHVRLRRALRGWQPALEIVGVYHSHPRGGAAASPTDVAAAMYPEWVQVIVGLGEGRAQVRAFRIAAGRARPIAIRWMPATSASRRGLRS